MKFGKMGVFYFTDMLDNKALSELASRVEGMGYSNLWYPEAAGYEAFGLGGYLLSQSKTLQVGSGIANIYARDPTSSAMGLNTLNKLYGGRFVLGLGVSHAPLVSDLRGHQYKKPVTTMRAYLDVMDQTWEGLGSTPEVKQVVLAALGPKMTQLADERTQGSFPYNITPEQATISKKNSPNGGAVICEQKICLCEDPTQARIAARAALAPYLPLPNYYNNWFRLGFNEADLADGGSDRLMDAMVYWGDAKTIKAKLKEYHDNGADQVVVQPINPDASGAMDYAALEAIIS